MRRALVAVAASCAVGLLLPAVGTGAVPRVHAALPVPVASIPRLALTESGASVHQVDVDGGFDPDPALDALETLGEYDGQPSWAQSGGTQHLAFVSTRDTGADAAGDVYVRLTPSEGDVRLARITCDDARESHPVVSTTDGRVAYATDRSGDWEVVVAAVPADGVDPCVVPVEPVAVAPGAGSDLWPAWLPQSTLLAFSSTRSDPLGDLYVADVDAPAAEPRRLTDQAGADTQPTVSGDLEPEGPPRAALAFTTTRFSGADSLALVELEDDGEGDASFSPVVTTDLAVIDTGISGSEPAFAAGDGEVGGFEVPLAFTTTTQDPAGDVWSVTLDDEGAELAVGFAGPVLGQPGVAESHGTWLAELSEGSGTLAAEIGDLPDVADVLVDDGSGHRVLARSTGPGSPAPEPLGDALPTWSPAGDRVAYTAQTAAGWALHVVDPAAPVVAPIVYDRLDTDIDVHPAWSPDGSRIAFTRFRDDGDGGYTDASVWVLQLASGEATEVELADAGPVVYDVGSREPSWSPDGTRLVLERSLERENEGVGFVAAPDDIGSWTELWVAEPGTGTSEPLTTTSVLPCPALPCSPVVSRVRGTSPAWSPDGARIAAASIRLAVGPDGPVSDVQPDHVGILRIADAASTEVVEIAALTGFTADGAPTAARSLVAAADEPAWSPDGSHVAVAAVPAGRPRGWGVWEVSADAAQVRAVVDTRRLEYAPAYQPVTDLVLTMVAGTPVGTGATLTLVATNAGPGRIEQGAVDLELPAGITTAGTLGCVLVGAQLTCPLPPLLPGEDVDLAVDLQLTGAAAAPVLGVATTTTPERVVSNNRAEALVGQAGGVSVAVSIDRPVLFVGGLPATATVTVRNVGTLPAAGVRLETSFPGTVVATGAEPCTAAGGVCELGLLGAGAVRVLTSTLHAVAPFDGPPLAGTVTGGVSTTSADPQPADDDAAAGLEVRSPQLALSPAVVRPGGVVFVTGQHFPPGEPVTLHWAPGVTGTPGPFTVGADGMVQTSLLLLKDSLLGGRRLEAAGTSPTPLFAPVDQDLLVVPTSSTAPSFLFRK